MKVVWVSAAALLTLPLLAAFGVAERDAVRTQAALADIPATYLALYEEAGAQFGVAWQLLAGIGKVESDHGRNPDGMRPNAAGAIGPMQFLPGTFAPYGHAAGHPHPDILDPHDAIFAAAALLSAAGVEHDVRSALWVYNHSPEYVDLVLRWAGAYGYGQVDAVRANIVRLAGAQIGKPYIWGATGPNGFDCSGLVRFVFGESGVALPRTAQEQYGATVSLDPAALAPGDLVFLKHTYPTTPAEPITHVAIYIGERQVVTAPNVGSRVRVESIDDPYWQAHWAGARTILGAQR